MLLLHSNFFSFLFFVFFCLSQPLHLSNSVSLFFTFSLDLSSSLSSLLFSCLSLSFSLPSYLSSFNNKMSSSHIDRFYSVQCARRLEAGIYRRGLGLRQPLRHRQPRPEDWHLWHRGRLPRHRDVLQPHRPHRHRLGPQECTTMNSPLSIQLRVYQIYLRKSGNKGKSQIQKSIFLI